MKKYAVASIFAIIWLLSIPTHTFAYSGCSTSSPDVPCTIGAIDFFHYIGNSTKIAFYNVPTGTIIHNSFTTGYNEYSGTNPTDAYLYNSCTPVRTSCTSVGAITGTFFDYTDGYYVQSETDPFFPPNITPRIISLDYPTLRQVIPLTATNTPVGFSVTLYNDSASAVGISLSSPDAGYFSLAPVNLPTIATGVQTLTATTSLPQGFYFATVYAVGTTTQISNTILSSFVVGTSTYSNISLDPNSLVVASTTALCTSGSNPIVGALCYLFMPSSQSFNNFTNLQVIIQTKAPIGYFTQTTSLFSALVTGTSTIVIPTFPTAINTYIFDPMWLGLGSIIFVWIGIQFYKRLKELHL